VRVWCECECGCGSFCLMGFTFYAMWRRSSVSDRHHHLVNAGVRGTTSTSPPRQLDDYMLLSLPRRLAPARSALAPMDRIGAGAGARGYDASDTRHDSRRKARGKETKCRQDQTPIHLPPSPLTASTKTLRPLTPLLAPPGNATWSEGATRGEVYSM
jgi:hypothetical protein